MNSVLRKILPDALAILFFVALSFAFFLTPVSKGWVLTGQDHSAAVGSSIEMENYRASHNGERTRWTNTLFGGMPTYQMAPSYHSTDTLNILQRIYKLWLPDYVVLVYVMLLGFYIMLRCFDFRAWMAALGAVMWAFSSYYFIIIGAGHIWKFYTLAFIPPTIAGMVLCYQRRRYLWGMLVTAFFMALQIISNHVQMSYYFLFVIALMGLAWLLQAIHEHQMRHWWCATAAFVAGCLIGVLINLSNLYHTYEYSRESMRGKSELTQVTKDPDNQTSSGLERSYITAWSYGIGETWSLLVPAVKGGASVPMSQNKTAMAKADPIYMPIYQSIGQYWGEQPGTSGPVYVGAFVLLLFILGLFVVKGRLKWALFIATLLSISLSWGKNFMGWTNLFLDFVPMYDKFRTVASILVIAEFTIPLLAIMTLKEIVEKPRFFSGETQLTFFSATVTAKNWHLLWLSFALTGGVCLLFYIMPDVFFSSFISTSEMNMLQNATDQGYIPADMLAPLLANLTEMRHAVLQADALRSLMIIGVGMLVLIAFHYQKIKAWAMLLCLTILSTLDLWDINKRYLPDSMFSAPKSQATEYAPTQTDKAILSDPDPYYRVVSMAVSTFNDNTTSYWHKSIGGYHAAKLRRYQELIEADITREMGAMHQAAAQHAGDLSRCNGDSLFPVLNMLNTKYAIVPLQGGSTLPVANPWHNGNAWFVDDIITASTADEELALLGTIDTKHQAIVNTQQFPLTRSATAPADTAAACPITLTSYEANALEYDAVAPSEALAVFSEIYYPGWTCTIDGAPAPILRANYVLRGVVIPEGKHHLVFTFDPQSLHTTEAVAYGALILLALLTIALVVKEVRTLHP